MRNPFKYPPLSFKGSRSWHVVCSSELYSQLKPLRELMLLRTLIWFSSMKGAYLTGCPLSHLNHCGTLQSMSVKDLRLLAYLLRLQGRCLQQLLGSKCLGQQRHWLLGLKVYREEEEKRWFYSSFIHFFGQNYGSLLKIFLRWLMDGLCMFSILINTLTNGLGFHRVAGSLFWEKGTSYEMMRKFKLKVKNTKQQCLENYLS